MDADVAAEVERQHRLLASWLGTVAEPGVLAEPEAAHTADFSMVTVEGHVLHRPALLDWLAAAGNSRPGLRILISDVTVVVELEGAVLAGFLETHVEHRHTSSRRVTALLRRDPTALRWAHVQETPLPS
ncbi:MAG TPA: hypothetical protein VH008_09725 [Pseudonocardia sp.]|jgi:hypothetical protein|nr:hypothetical protein [Pseudonocardia sp.]